jgi:hypothetical protein
VQINEAFLGLLNAMSVTRQHWIDLLSAGEANPMAPRSFLKADVAAQMLRNHIRTWIDSGFQKDGSEEPARRTYKTWGCQAIFETLGPVLGCFHSIPATGVFALQANKQAPTPQLGSLSARFNPRGGVELVPVVFSGALSEEQLAAWGFYLFWKSELLFTLMRCARCGVFAIPARKPRGHYLRGWHCQKCRNIAPALRGTETARKQKRDEWFALAVIAYLNFDQHPRRLTSNRILFIVERVNAGLSVYERIKRHTITRNLKEIQAKAEARKQNAQR